jgi:organic hydroperoxide reductase OsmC/OhrA
MLSEVLLKPTVVIHSEQYAHKVIRILKKAEDACLISHSIKSKVSMETDIQVKPILIESE